MKLASRDRVAMLAAFVAIGVAGCAADLIGPEDPEWFESCVFTLSQDTPFTITREELGRCSDVKFQMVNFCGFDNYPSEAVVEWEGR